jgi:purine-binding chemotaxis protein CheW
MVDLVKIRKKAKKVAEDRSQGTGNRSQVTGEESHVTPSVSEGPGREGGATPPATKPIAEEPAAAPPPGPLAPARGDKLSKFKEEAGRLRESADTTTEVALPATQLEVLTFVIAGESYAVDIEGIVEIVTPRPVTRVPNADGAIVGIISLRGTIVTLLDVRSRLRHPRAAETPDTRIIVVDHHGEPVGFEVDHVLRVIKLAAGEVEAHPVVHTSELDESIRGVFRHAGALTILLDFDKLLGLRALAAARA